MYFHYIAVSDMNNSKNAQKSVVPLDFQLYHLQCQFNHLSQNDIIDSSKFVDVLGVLSALFH